MKSKKVKAKQPCPKCGGKEFEMAEVYVAGSLMERLFSVENQKFTTLTCVKCKYTEFYKVPLKRARNVLDTIMG